MLFCAVAYAELFRVGVGMQKGSYIDSIEEIITEILLRWGHPKLWEPLV